MGEHYEIKALQPSNSKRKKNNLGKAEKIFEVNGKIDKVEVTIKYLQQQKELYEKKIAKQNSKSIL